MHRHVQDVMTRDVVTVRGSSPFKEIVRTLAEHRVSALPVVDEVGRLVGIVSEGDLVLRQEHPRPYDGGPLPDQERLRAERAKVAAITATELMTSPVVTLFPETPIPEAARLLHDKAVKRAPVVDRSGQVVGIVSRLDLLRVFLRDDAEILRDVIDALFSAPFRVKPSQIKVRVSEGRVVLEGRVERRTYVPDLTRLIQQVDGVVAVDNRLGFAYDDIMARGVDVSRSAADG